MITCSGALLGDRPSLSRSIQPDLLVARRMDVEPWGMSAAPLLVVEVLSPGTRLTDVGTKRMVYDESGVGAHWLVDPLAHTVTVLERADAGALATAATVRGR